MAGLWRNRGPGKGKYLITRRDGTIPEWPAMVLGARDPAAPAALRAYADAAEKFHMDAQYVADVRKLADEFEAYRQAHTPSYPDHAQQCADDPETVAKMKRGDGA